MPDSFFPALRREVTLRAENFGGYLFDPRGHGAVELGTTEFFTAQYCNGLHTVASITAEMASVEGWEQEAAKETTWQALKRLQGLGVLEWLMTGEETSRFAAPPPFTSQDEGVLGRALSAPLSVLWDITYACNLHCLHCLTGSGKAAADELTREEALVVLERLLAMRVFSITFCGGEPVLCPHLFEVIEAAVARGMEVNLDTNGLLVDENLADKLAAAGVTAVQVSLDGTEETHDRFRGRKGSYASAVSAVRVLRERGFRVSVAPVLTSMTHQDLEYLVHLAVDLGATGFKPSLFLPTGRGRENAQSLRLSPEIARADFQTLRRLQKQFEGRLHIAVEGSYPDLDVVAGRPAPAGDSYAGAPLGCPAGVTQMVIAANGKVYACPFLYDFPAGDLRQESLADVWRHARIFKVFRNMTKGQLQGQCRVCSYAPEHCAGGCRAAAYALSGNLYGQDPLCWNAAPARGCERSQERLA